jgi:hypothetical protein
MGSALQAFLFEPYARRTHKNPRQATDPGIIWLRLQGTGDAHVSRLHHT